MLSRRRKPLRKKKRNPAEKIIKGNFAVKRYGHVTFCRAARPFSFFNYYPFFSLFEKYCKKNMSCYNRCKSSEEVSARCYGYSIGI